MILAAAEFTEGRRKAETYNRPQERKLQIFLHRATIIKFIPKGCHNPSGSLISSPFAD